MLDVAIIGAGELGGAIAHVLARTDIVSSVRLIDEMGHIAAGKALDIMQASPIEGFSTRVSGTNDVFAAAGASLLIVADMAVKAGSSGLSEWHGDEGLKHLERVSQIAPDRIVICAGAWQRDLVERGARELHMPRTRIFGSAPEALAAAVRAFVALEANGSPSDVSLTVLGVPPSQVVIPWDQATIGGVSLVRVLDEPACRRLAARVAPLWPPGAYALASAAVKAVACIAEQSRAVVSGFVAPDDSSGELARTVALPLRLGWSGVVSAELPPLSVHDRVALDNARLR
jgi:malate dehydrogenase